MLTPPVGEPADDAPDPPVDASDLVTRNPWWIPPIFGRVPPVPRHALRVLGLVTLALLFEAYDLSMLTAALPHIARDLGMPEASLPNYLGTIRMGALPALLLLPFADRLGRRRVFLWSLVGLTTATALTALAATAVQFVVAQMAARPFVLAGSAVAIVIVSEEFPAAHRGWAVGVLGALSAVGHGIGAILFAFIHQLPGEWRTLYAFGAVPLLLFPLFRRELRETRRFARHRTHAGGELGGWLAPMARLVTEQPRRALSLGLAVTLLSIADAAAFQFTSWFLHTVHGWAPADYSQMVILAGAFGICGNVVAGRLGDRIGRRVIGAAFMTIVPLAVWLFYRGPAALIPLAWTIFVFCDTGAVVILRALSAELFGTSHRGTAAGLIATTQTLALAAGLYAVSLGQTDDPDFIARTTTWLSLAAIGAGAVLFTLPETRRQELEAIA